VSPLHVPRCVLLLCVVLASPVWAAGERLLAWQIQGQNAQVVLLGSVHMAYPEIYPLRDALEQAFAEADKLVVEVDIGGANTLAIQQLMLERGMLPEGESLQQYLSPQTWADLQHYLRSRGLPVDMFARLRPGLVVTTLSSMRIAELGMRPELGIDRHFLDRAKDKKPIMELESVQQQIELLLAFPEPDLLISQTLVQLDEIDLYLRPIYDAWRAGDPQLLNRLLLVDEQERNPQFQPVYDLFFVQRNRAMTEKIDSYLRGKGSYFVVVGAGHLVGDEGIISLLLQRGYRAQQL
jgi:uncharacterized protein YbaP (TraB family)